MFQQFNALAGGKRANRLVGGIELLGWLWAQWLRKWKRYWHMGFEVGLLRARRYHPLVGVFHDFQLILISTCFTSFTSACWLYDHFQQNNVRSFVCAYTSEITKE